MSNFDASNEGLSDDFGSYDGLGISCPNCGSTNIVYDNIDGYFSCEFCKDCGYKKPKNRFEKEDGTTK